MVQLVFLPVFGIVQMGIGAENGGNIPDKGDYGVGRMGGGGYNTCILTEP